MHDETSAAVKSAVGPGSDGGGANSGGGSGGGGMGAAGDAATGKGGKYDASTNYGSRGNSSGGDGVRGGGGGGGSGIVGTDKVCGCTMIYRGGRISFRSLVSCCGCVGLFRKYTSKYSCRLQAHRRTEEKTVTLEQKKRVCTSPGVVQ